MPTGLRLLILIVVEAVLQTLVTGVINPRIDVAALSHLLVDALSAKRF